MGLAPSAVAAGVSMPVEFKTNRIPMEWVRECFRLDRDTGFLYWNERPRHHFELAPQWARFNAYFAGKRADLAIYPTSGYRRVRVMYEGKKIAISAHRLAFALAYGRWPGQLVDHIDRDRTNNRPINLRDVDARTNLLNSVYRGAPRQCKFSQQLRLV